MAAKLNGKGLSFPKGIIYSPVEKFVRSASSHKLNLIIAATTAVFLFLFSYCKDDTPVTVTEEIVGDNTLQSADSMEITYNNLKYIINKRGRIEGIDLSNAGLWLAAIQDGKPVADIIFQGPIPYSNYIAKMENSKSGVYKFVSNEKKYIPDEFIKSLGIPLNGEGSIAVYGDEMFFSSLTGDSTLSSIPIYSAPIKNVRVNQTVFGYKRDDIKDVVFIKYEIKNLSGADLNLTAGFYSDTDIEAIVNSVGYDSTRGLTYTYLVPAYRIPNKTLGFAFLEAPKKKGTLPAILSHRIIRKNLYVNPEFGEYGMISAQKAFWALNGLDNNGNPMINPETNQVTKFAFTGDPINETGWLDVKVDVRNLLSIESFNLASTQTATIIVALFLAEGDTYRESIPRLKEKLDMLRNRTELWKF